MSTTFTTVSTASHYDEWPDSWEEVVTRVDGDLADKIRAKLNAPSGAIVEIFERGDEGGYSEYTVEWDWEFEVKISGRTVWSTSGWSQTDFDEKPAPKYNSLGNFIKWANS